MAWSVQSFDLDFLSDVEDRVVGWCFGDLYRVFSCNDGYLVILELEIRKLP